MYWVNKPLNALQMTSVKFPPNLKIIFLIYNFETFWRKTRIPFHILRCLVTLFYKEQMF